MNVSRHRSLCIITFSLSDAGITPLSNLVDILLDLSTEKLYLITGDAGFAHFNCKNNLGVYNVIHGSNSNSVLKIFGYLITQLRFSVKLLNIIDKTKICIFFLGGECMTLPIILAKVCGKKVILVFGGSPVKICSYTSPRFCILMKLIQNLNCKISDKIITYSSLLINEYNLQSFQGKILVNHRHFVNRELFKQVVPIDARKNIICYVGRLSKEKGVINFLESVPLILARNKDVSFLLIGEGELEYDLRKFLSDNNLDTHVKFLNWVPHDKMPKYLNTAKLLVLPSYTEGLPNVMLEAMACGTPILATSVGAIPDLIADDMSGFIMQNNTPECISSCVIKVLENPRLGMVVNNAASIIEEEFTFSNVVKKWSKILKNTLIF